MTPLTEAEIRSHARKILDLIALDTDNKLFYGTPVDMNNTLHLISAAYSLGCLLYAVTIH